jgi:sec-independent protein translocase protein TatB
MFDIGVPEMIVIVIVAVVVFGPERLPDFARQLGRLVRTVRQMADNAKADLQREMGEDYTTLRDEIRGLDPREMMKSTFEDEDPEPRPSRSETRASQRPLEPGEPAPFDVDAT